MWVFFSSSSLKLCEVYTQSNIEISSLKLEFTLSCKLAQPSRHRFTCEEPLCSLRLLCDILHARTLCWYVMAYKPSLNKLGYPQCHCSTFCSLSLWLSRMFFSIHLNIPQRCSGGKGWKSIQSWGSHLFQRWDFKGAFETTRCLLFFSLSETTRSWERTGNKSVMKKQQEEPSLIPQRSLVTEVTLISVTTS